MRKRLPFALLPENFVDHAARFGKNDAAHPLGLVPSRAPQAEPLFGLRAVAGDDVHELVPVGLAELPDPVIVLAQLRVGNRQPAPRSEARNRPGTAGAPHRCPGS